MSVYVVILTFVFFLSSSQGKGDSYFDRDIGMYTSVMNMTVDNGGYSIIHAYFDTKSVSQACLLFS